MQYSLNSPDCQGAEDKQRTQYLLIPCLNGGCSKTTDNSKIGMSRCLDPSTTHDTNGLNHGPVVALERNLYGHPEAGLLWEGQCEKILLKYVWEKVSNLECLVVRHEKRVLLICVCGRLKIG